MISKRSNLAPCLAVFGTASEVGKSITAAALCRIFSNLGLSVAPFKAQNMSNNSGVTPEGGEMGRAQVVQAEAAGVAPHVDMNPVLLKPSSDIGCQVVVLGKVFGNRKASAYYRDKAFLFETACQALDRLRREHDLIIMEGAGSCAEVNLSANDIVNFPMAEYADAQIILVADIHRGGVFAQCVGTLECLPPARQDRIIGFLINRFRGDPDLFEDGIRWIETKTGKHVLGFIPWYKDIQIEAEDAVVIDDMSNAPMPRSDEAAVAVVRLPHISNFTDFDPLFRVKHLTVSFIEKARDLTAYRAVVLPGTKNTRQDLKWLVDSGWVEALKAYKENGGYILGICGGYQMLGHKINDPEGLEGNPGTSQCLMFLPVETTLTAPKTTTRTEFSYKDIKGKGYEIHMGKTVRIGGHPLFEIHSRNGNACRDSDGCVSENRHILGTYIHGFLDNPQILLQWLSSICLEGLEVDEYSGPVFRDQQYDMLGQHFLKHMNVEPVINAVGIEL